MAGRNINRPIRMNNFLFLPTRLALGRLACSLAITSIVLLTHAPLHAAPAVTDSSPLPVKAKYLQRDLLDKHWLDGLYVSMVPSAPAGTQVPHTVDQPGNVIHAGVWTGRYS